jgi:hypothetical protein
MSTLPLPDDYVRCLAHTHRRNEWCPHSETCARQLTIRHDRQSQPVSVHERLCVSNEFEMFVAVEEAA